MLPMAADAASDIRRASRGDISVDLGDEFGLRLYRRKQAQRDSLHGRDVELGSEGLASQERDVRWVCEEVQNPHSGVVRKSRDPKERDRAGEKHQALM